MVDNDTETLSLLLPDTSLLDLAQGETTTESNFGVVSDGWASNGRSEELERSNTEGECLGLTGDSSTELASWLVEPGLDPLL